MNAQPAETQPDTLPVKGLAGLLALSSLLQYLSFFPINWGFLGWFALVPFLWTVRVPQSPRAGWIIWAVSFCQYLASLRWMMVADERMIATWVLLAWWCSLFPWAAWKLLRVLDRKTGLPLAFMVPLVWIPLEHARAYLLTGFPWYYLAHTQHDSVALLQTADFAGTQFLSALVAMWNGWLADLSLRANPKAVPGAAHRVNRPLLAINGAIVLALTALSLIHI
jgi:apolipoprotein N-acyltransferase